jgi:hypothetical protein
MQVGPRFAAGEYCRLLCERHVDKWRRFFSQTKMFDIADNADDLAGTQFVDRVGIVAKKNLLADGIFVREKLARKRLVYRDHPQRGFRIVLIEVAAFDQRNL